jgi:transcriptional regulator with XRE-family HTH domain
MSNSGFPLMPKYRRILAGMGENIKLARLRRKLSAEQVALRAGISRPTLVSIEKGVDTVSMGSYFMVLHVLRLDEDFLLLAKDDVLGRRLQDLKLMTKQRAPKK